ncbi:CPBP family intramembrane glutamic endopeptidase [Enterococcus sp. DIV0187]|uniref:CPBP family intramembrane glutamic endopeptidase n=1 Tax=Enterococcus sp. DIV0187 TaxID=2774644 RepID=UPI003F294E74
MGIKKNVISYLGITFGITWICWGIVACLTHFMNLALFSPIVLPIYSLGAAGPMIGACIVMKRTVGKTGFKRFVRNIFNLKQPITAYLVVLGLAWGFCLFPTLFGASEQQAPIYTALFQLPVMIFFGGGLEEVGWRGFLLPQLQKKFSSFISTCIIAVIWTVWHLPLWLVKGSGQDASSFIGFMIMVLSFAFLLTLLWDRYQSIALCILLHAGFNSFADVYPPNYGNLSTALPLLGLCCLIFLVASLLSRGSLADHAEK